MTEDLVTCPVCQQSFPKSDMIQYISQGGYFPDRLVCKDCYGKLSEDEESQDQADEYELDVDED